MSRRLHLALRLGGLCAGVLLIAAGCLAYPLLAPARGLEWHRIDVGDRVREYGLRPSSSERPGRPAILVFHGFVQSVGSIQRLTRFENLDGPDDPVIVYPKGYRLSWNDGDDTKPATRDGVDDVGFVEALIDELVRDHGVDPDRVYAAGFSNGGFFLLRSHCRLANRLAAVGVVGAGVYREVDLFCDGRRSVPAMFVLGNEDPMVPWGGWDGYRGTLPADSGPLWARLDKCLSTPDTHTMQRDDDDTRVEVDTYRGCQDGADVVFAKVVGGGHTWPGGPRYLPSLLVGDTNRDLDLTTWMWEFFARHHRVPRSPALAQRIFDALDRKAPGSDRRAIDAGDRDARLVAELEGTLDGFLSAADGGHPDVEYELNRIGYALLADGREDDAVAVMRLAVARFPDSWNAHDSLGEALLRAGHRQAAVESYRRSLQLEPGNDNATRVLDDLVQ